MGSKKVVSSTFEKKHWCTLWAILDHVRLNKNEKEGVNVRAILGHYALLYHIRCSDFFFQAWGVEREKETKEGGNFFRCLRRRETQVSAPHTNTTLWIRAPHMRTWFPLWWVCGAECFCGSGKLVDPSLLGITTPPAMLEAKTFQAAQSVWSEASNYFLS